jgi:hypothetical protein
MELVIFFYHFLVSLDKLWQKPLHRIVPDLEKLLADPADYLSYQEITIHPWRRWVRAFIWGLYFDIGAFVFCFVVGSVLMNADIRPPRSVAYLLLIGFIALMIVGPFLIVFIGTVLVGSRCILGRNGARFVRGSTEVVCPWSVFAAAGQPIVDPVSSRNRMLLPIAPNAVGLVEARTGDTVVAKGLDVKTRQVRMRSSGELIIENLYQLNPHELGSLLLHLGRVLGTPPKRVSAPPTFDAEQAYSAPPPTVAKDGWITVSLTRLNFLPVCCDCGDATTATKRFRAVNGFEQAHLDVYIPVCEPCQKQYRRRYWKAFGKFFLLYEAVAAALGFALGALIGLQGQGGILMLQVAIAFAVMAALLAPCFIWFFRKWPDRWASPPARVRAYNPKKGTIALQFRRAEYGEQLLLLLQAMQC